MEVQRVSAGSASSELASYSRAVRAGDFVFVSGAVARGEDGKIKHSGDPEKQAELVLSRISEALASLNASLDDVVETRVYVTDISQWEGVGRAHGSAFRNAQPATTLVQVSRLVAPEAMVEISAVALMRRK